MRLLYVVMFCLFLSVVLPVAAQEATIVGTVTDNSGALVPKATITITNTATGIVRTLTTNESGQYVASALAVGNYKVKAEASGFAVVETTGVVLSVNDRRRIDFSMRVGGKTESVQVEANTIAVKTDSGEVSGLITGQQITQLSTNGRSLYAIVNLTPGASSLQSDFQVPTPMGGDQSVSFNGQRFSHNLYMIDGAEAADRGGSGAIVMPSIDAVSEFRQLTSNYSAEYGVASAATITTVVKSGTRTLHAAAWWFGRNDAFNARNFFQPRYNANGTQNQMPKLRFNIWGFNVGGPVQFKKNSDPKTFFFYNMEWRKLITKGSIRTNVPFADTYGGNLNTAVNFGLANILQSGQTSLHAPYACRVSTAVANAFAAVGQALSGCTGGAPDSNLNQAFVYNGQQNVINPALLNSNAQNLLKAGIFPAPVTGNTFIGGPNAPTDVREEIVRVDHTFNQKFAIFGHFIAEQILQTDIPTRWSGANLPTVWDTFGNPSYSAVVHLTHTISPSLLNEIAFNYGGNRIQMLPAGVYKLADTNFKQNKIFGFKTDTTPVISLGGKTGSNYNANWNPWVNSADSYQFRDDLSWVKGNHQLKFGFGILNFRKLQPLQVSAQGSFTFNGNFTGYDFSDFLLGLASGYSEPALKDSRQWNSMTYNTYVQDNWRVTKRLTLNLGLRWDGMPHTAEVNDQMANFYPALWDASKAPVVGTTVGGVFVPAPGGFSNANGTQICSGNNIPAGSGCTVANGALATGPNPDLNGLLQYANGIGVAGVTPGVDGGLVANHWNNWGPRVGFAYDLFGSGKTVIRGGFGINYERIQGNDMYQMSTPLFGGAASFNNVSLNDPHIGVDQTNTSVSTATLPVTVNSITVINGDKYKNPATYQYSAGVQQQLTRQTVLSASYVGNFSRHLSDIQEYDLPDISLLNTWVSQSTASARYNTFLPYAGYHAISVEQNEANSLYNSLQIDLRSHMHDLNLQVGYTFSKAEDPTTGNGGDGFDLNRVTNSYCGWKCDWGPSIFDRRHVMFVSFVYDIPFFRSSANKALKYSLGGWQLSGVVTAQTGPPIDLGVAGNSICGTIVNCRVRPNLVGNISYPKSKTTLANGQNTELWFDPTAFTGNYIPSTVGTSSLTATFGTLGKNALRGPGRQNWNIAVFKQVPITERLMFEFRTEAYNLWNHTQFRGDVVGGTTGGVNVNVGTGASPDVGKFTQAWDPRTLQFGAKLIF